MGIENYMNIRRDVGAHIRTHKADRTDYRHVHDADVA